MRIKPSRQNIVSINNYNIDGGTLEEVEHHPYLGVELGNHLNWNHPSVVEMSISAPGASM
jgi:hypothetical protein